MDTIARKIARIAEKLQQARAQQVQGFGISSHGMLTNPPIEPARLKALEAEFGLYLPDDYRAFLLEIGDGGAGPLQGMPPLQEAIADADTQSEFPVAYGERAVVPFRELRRGSLRVCRHGYGAWQGRLAILGAARGRVVYVTEDDSAPPYFVWDGGFLAWYERWLDDLLAGEPDPRFGFDNPDMEDGRLTAPDPAPVAPGRFQEQLERVREKLFDQCDPPAERSYRPPVARAALAELERRHGIELPEDYRGFLEYVQAGGPGPYYGLVPMEYSIPEDPAGSQLAVPFPFTPESALAKGCPGVTLKKGRTSPPGVVALAHMGLGRYARLVVSGEARGRVFYLDQDRPGCLPYFVRDVNFLDWYERWLGEGGRNDMFGFDNPAYTVAWGGHPRQIRWKPK